MKQKLKELLSLRKKHCITKADLKPAAVLVPIFCKNGEYHILFTRRTEKVKVHKGQISFPGGAYEEKDCTLLATALRESAEEIGLRPEDVEILGELDDSFSVPSNYSISPFVAQIPCPYKFEINEDEIDEIIEVPVSALVEDKHSTQVTEVRDDDADYTHVYKYQGTVIWGATARIAHQFLEIFSQVNR